LIVRSLLFLSLLASAQLARAAAPGEKDRAGDEFFEKEVRPLLALRCFDCHGPKLQKNGLRLDSRAAILAGGASGPAVVPGKPAESLLVEAINYGGDQVQMPPKSKLPDAEVATLTRWVALGAPWPGGDFPAATSGPIAAFDLKARSRHWSLQPLRPSEPPPVQAADWPRNAVDQFLLAQLEAKSLAPAHDADRRTLIRRVTFDLTGLPPSPAEIHAFLSDRSPGAYEKVVDRLLASPHYGERWARHWLDLVRFAETAGHEFDYDIQEAFRYRDYVVRALNADLTYNRFVVEHLAGDLLNPPRQHPGEGFNESILATGFYWLGEGVHSPVDIREEQVRRIDNQIDVLSKTFLGLTISCARCHDHKFDAVSTQDYYALAGYLRSSRQQQAFIDDESHIGARVAELLSLKSLLRTALLDDTNVSADKHELSTYLPALLPTQPERTEIAGGSQAKPLAERAASSLDQSRLGRWSEALADASVNEPNHPLYAWKSLVSGGGSSFTSRRDQLVEQINARRKESDQSSIVFEDWSAATFTERGWSVSGDAFSTGPTGVGEFRVQNARLVPVAPGFAHSGLVSDRLQGVLRSKTFTIEQKKIHYLAAGRGGRINLVIDGYEKIRDPIYGGLSLRIDHGDLPRWYVQDVSMWLGHHAYVEIADGGVVEFNGPQSSHVSGDGWVAVGEIRFSNAARLASPVELTLELLDDREVDGPEKLADRYEKVIEQALADCRAVRFRFGRQGSERLAALGWLMARDFVRVEGLPRAQFVRYQEVESRIPPPTLALAMADGDGEDEHVFVRGNYKTPGEKVPRRFLEAISGPNQPPPALGSGRLELALRIVDPSNPLPARVMVNRIWKHHFGEGLVRSLDDLGAMGQPPTHPALLDWLATEFIRTGWSIKAMHRLIVLSRGYQMSSVSHPPAERADPENRLLHRMNTRRLEAEAIRDAILTVSGRLDRTMAGPSVPPYLTAFLDGRGRPGASGPLDGNGRRTLYLNVRRNFQNPMLLAFDLPAPASTMGRRNVSHVPAQALTLLNDPLVLDQARLWARRVDARLSSRDAVIDDLFESAFGRPPTAAERAQVTAFVNREAVRGDADPWAQICHVLFNMKEFIFIQ
jgi:hypothetical protein